jgi:hypothetical protein
VIIKTNQEVDNYWISVIPQFRKGAPAGYAVLNYNGAPKNALPGAGHSIVQPQEGAELRKWSMEQVMSVSGHFGGDDMHIVPQTVPQIVPQICHVPGEYA